MALSRRTGQRFQSSIWPGFVDAMTGLLLVLMFVLTIFMVVQSVLTETISGQESELDTLNLEVAELARALGLSQTRADGLEAEVTTLNATLADNQLQIESLLAQTAAQQTALSEAQAKITGFEAQVAALIAQRDDALSNVSTLEGEKTELLTAQEALNTALAQARDEISAQEEAARLAAARREALEALTEELRAKNAEQAQALTDEEAARLAEAEAAKALRERLQNADAELTAMTLALEEQRKRAEETLTKLAAAEAVQKDLNQQLATIVLARDALQQELAGLQADSQGEVLSREQLQQKLANALAAQQEAQAVAEKVGTLEEELAAALAAQQDTAAQLKELRDAGLSLDDQLAAALTARSAAEDRAALAEDASAALEEQLAAALAAQQEAEAALTGQLTEAEQRAALLAAANSALSDKEAESAEAQRRVTLLNQQLGALRTQLGQLQSLLDDAKARDAASQVQLESLGSDLNAALARAAAEERRRRELEEAERKRLEAETARLTAETKELEKYRSDFFGRLRDLLGAQDGVQIVGDRFVFSSEVLFDQGSADLSEAGQTEIAKVAGILKSVIGEIPADVNWIMRVDGHTDNIPLSGTGEFADNWELSQARALSVVRYMVSTLGIPADRLSANGFGEYQPVNSANTAEARAQNRRIELKFTEK